MSASLRSSLIAPATTRTSPTGGDPRSREIRRRLISLLQADSFAPALEEIRAMTAKQVAGPLIGLFCHGEALVRWHAITALGAVVDGMAESNEPERARVIMRRLMWSLNDESGGIGWGAPEALGEIMARNPRMASEFHRILVSYAREDGNYLEHPVLQRGLLWGLGRLAHARPDLIGFADPLLAPFFTSDDPHHRGLAVWAAGPLAGEGTKALIKGLTGDNAELVLYVEPTLVPTTVGDLARTALAARRSP